MVNEQKYLKREYCCNDSGFHDHSMKKPPEGGFWNLAERTGLEPATLGVTGRYSNQLNYRSRYCIMRVTA
jgi:hypothetical protein